MANFDLHEDYGDYVSVYHDEDIVTGNRYIYTGLASLTAGTGVLLWNYKNKQSIYKAGCFCVLSTVLLTLGLIHRFLLAEDTRIIPKSKYLEEQNKKNKKQ